MSDPAGRPSLVTATHVIFDFDGPICRLFAQPLDPDSSSARALAEEFADLLGDRPGLLSRLPLDDPHGIYRGATAHLILAGEPDDPVIAKMRTRLNDHERESVDTAAPTPHAERLIKELSARGVTLGIASNNHAPAVRAYLEEYGLAGYFGRHVVGRPDDARLMKPNPRTIKTLLNEWRVGPGRCVMIGDSPSDVRAARRARIAFHGYHRHHAKRERLRRAADPGTWVVGDMGEFVSALQTA